MCTTFSQHVYNNFTKFSQRILSGELLLAVTIRIKKKKKEVILVVFSN